MPTLVAQGQYSITDVNDGYTLTVTGGTRAVVYDGSGYNPSVSTSAAFGFILYKGTTSLTTGLTYSWTAGGIASINGSNTSNTATVNFAASHVTTESFIQLSVTETATGLVFTEKVPIVATRTGAQGNPGSDGFTLVVTGGTRNVTYDATGKNAAPANTAFTATMYRGATEVSGATYAFSTSGLLTGSQAASTTKTFTPTGYATDFSVTNSAVTVTAVGGGVTLTEVIPIAITRVGNTGSTGLRAATQAFMTGNTWVDANAVTAITSLQGISSVMAGDRVTLYTEPKWKRVKGSYSSTVAYFKDELVKSGTKIYKVISASVLGVQPGVTSGWADYWVEFCTPTSSVPSIWTSNTAYVVNDYVSFRRVSTNKDLRVIQVENTVTSTEIDSIVSGGINIKDRTLTFPTGSYIYASTSANSQILINTLYYVISFNNGLLVLGTIPDTPISFTDTTTNVTLHNSSDQGTFVCIANHTSASTDTNIYRDFIEGYSQTKYYDGANWQSVVAYFDGNVIVTGTLSVGALKSGLAAFGNTKGTFALGGNEVLFNRRATARFTSEGGGNIALFTLNTSYSETEWCHGHITGNFSKNGYGHISYNAANSFGNYRTVFYSGSANEAAVARRLVEGNTKNTTQLYSENIGFIHNSTDFSSEERALLARSYVEFTRKISPITFTAGSNVITITGHDLQAGHKIYFEGLPEGKNITNGTYYKIESVSTNGISIYAWNAASTDPAIVYNGTANETNITAFVRERPYRALSSISSTTFTTATAHNFHPGFLIKFKNVTGSLTSIFGTVVISETAVFRVKAVISSTQFSVYHNGDETNQYACSLVAGGTVGSNAIVYGANPERTAADICHNNWAGRFVLYTNQEKTTSSVTQLSTVISGSYYGIHTTAAGFSTVGFTPFTGKHIGIVNIEDYIELGDILVDESVLAKFDISNTICKQVLSSIPNQKGVIGVAAQLEEVAGHSDIVGYKENIVQKGQGIQTVEKEPIIESLYTPLSTEKNIYVNALGEGQINVCNENGNIEIGDLIVTSSIPGKGMKQSDDIIRSYTVAKSRENVTFDYPGQIKQIACIYLCG